jgi:hypothetical protein
MRAALRVVWAPFVLAVLATGTSAARADAPSGPGTPAAAPPPAVAAPAAPAPAPDRPKVFPRFAPTTMSHYQQFGIALLSGSGYRVIFPYQENVYCGQTTSGQADKRACTARLPWFLDVQPSFGFGDHWDVLMDLRFGLEQDFTGTHQFAVAPGVRYWVEPADAQKFFATVQIAYDTTAQHASSALTHNDDVALRNSNGFMYEVMRNFGAYVQLGETIGFVRWLRFEIDAGIGVQARLP